MNTKYLKLIGAMTVAGLMAACASHPDTNAALEHAHNRYDAAAGNPQVASLAAAELQRAATTLSEADKAQKDREPTSRVEQLAYLSSQRVAIAEETASARAAEANTAKAAAERDRLRLAMRTQEADAAKAQAANANANAANANANAAAADAAAAAAIAQANRDQARVERRDARLAELQAQLQDLQAKQTDRGMVVTLGDVLFDTGKATLLPASRASMDKLATFFKAHPDQRATIEGYTDSVGSAEYNQNLSQRRAQAVMSELVALGVPADRFTTRAYGEERPVASNDTSAGRQLNRRVEILFAALPAQTVSQR